MGSGQLIILFQIHNYLLIQLHHFSLPIGSTTPITSKGTIQYNRDIKLEHVLCGHSFHLNLISASKLSKTINCCIILLPNGCIMQDLPTGRIIDSGEQRGGLYYMKPLKKLPDFFHVSSNTDLWHMRFGHPSSSHLKLTSLLFSFNMSTHNNCNICPIAKQTRLPFTSSAINTQRPFDLLHCDI